jgi:hypothetical protein
LRDPPRLINTGTACAIPRSKNAVPFGFCCGGFPPPPVYVPAKRGPTEVGRHHHSEVDHSSKRQRVFIRVAREGLPTVPSVSLSASARASLATTITARRCPQIEALPPLTADPALVATDRPLRTGPVRRPVVLSGLGLSRPRPDHQRVPVGLRRRLDRHQCPSAPIRHGRHELRRYHAVRIESCTSRHLGRDSEEDPSIRPVAIRLR